MNSLFQLYLSHKGKVSDKWSIYLSTYERIFSEYRHKPIRLLEVGVQNGGSLEIWSKYFPMAVKLIGCDINPACAALQYQDARISVVVGDANSESAAKQIAAHAEGFDLVIDDGSHRSGDIIKTFARYFPKIVEGGMFVAEDLHCSYWQEFEGGLHDPYSSMSFFKLLADVVNREHWGTQTRSSELVQGIAQHYATLLTDEVLSTVHSVEFINSICVIRKSAPLHNQLGSRVVAGQVAAVWPGALNSGNISSSPMDQSANQWANLDSPPGELIVGYQRALTDLARNHEHKVAELEDRIAALLNSTSWRATAPLRLIVHQFKRAQHVMSILPTIIQQSGGIRSTCTRALSIFKREGMQGIRTRWKSYHSSGSGSPTLPRNNYQEWVRRYDTLDDITRQLIRDSIGTWHSPPLISVIMPTYNANPEWLRQAVESVRAQLYPHWELCIADDASTDTRIRPLLELLSQQDGRIKVSFRDQNGHISAASNTALGMATGQWIALLDHDDLLSETALFHVAERIVAKPEARVIYSDEDKIDQFGRRHNPYFKCEWNPDLFYSQNMLCHLGVYDSELLHSVGGFRVGFEGAQDYDLALRCIEQISVGQIEHISKVLYHWRVHASSTSGSVDAKPYAKAAGERALNEHFHRIGIRAKASHTERGYRVQYHLPTPAPLVSLLIPTRDHKTVVETAVQSILEKTTYPRFEIIIIDNGSTDSDSLRWFSEIQSKDSRVKVIRYDFPFNYSAINNFGVAHASGEVIGLINNDIEVIAADWLSEMVSHALRPEIGCVGAKLNYSNGTLQHGGVVLGIGGVAGHSHKHYPPNAGGYFSRLQLVSNYSAVTAACLLVRKDVFLAAKGLDEENLKVAFNDVDFCLKVRELGYRNLWTPYAVLFHHESISRGSEDTPEKKHRFQSEALFMKAKWGAKLLNDPYYSPNLTLEHEDFSLSWPPRISP